MCYKMDGWWNFVELKSALFWIPNRRSKAESAYAHTIYKFIKCRRFGTKKTKKLVKQKFENSTTQRTGTITQYLKVCMYYILEIHRGAIWKTFEQIPRGCTYAIRVVHGSKSVCYCLLLPVGLLVCGFFSKSWEAGRRGEKEEKRMHIFLQSQKMSLWALQHCLGLPVLFHTENGQKDWPKQSNAKFIYCLNALPTSL